MSCWQYPLHSISKQKAKFQAWKTHAFHAKTKTTQTTTITQNKTTLKKPAYHHAQGKKCFGTATWHNDAACSFSFFSYAYGGCQFLSEDNLFPTEMWQRQFVPNRNVAKTICSWQKCGKDNLFPTEMWQWFRNHITVPWHLEIQVHTEKKPQLYRSLPHPHPHSAIKENTYLLPKECRPPPDGTRSSKKESSLPPSRSSTEFSPSPLRDFALVGGGVLGNGGALFSKFLWFLASTVLMDGPLWSTENRLHLIKTHTARKLHVFWGFFYISFEATCFTPTPSYSSNLHVLRKKKPPIKLYFTSMISRQCFLCMCTQYIYIPPSLMYRHKANNLNNGTVGFYYSSTENSCCSHTENSNLPCSHYFCCHHCYNTDMESSL